MNEEKEVCCAYSHKYQSHDRVGNNEAIFSRLDEHREEGHEKEYCLWIKEGDGDRPTERIAVVLREIRLPFPLRKDRL